MRSVSFLLDTFAPPQNSVGPGGRPRLLTAVPRIRARVILVGRLEGDVALLEAHKYSSLVSLLLELVVVLQLVQIVQFHELFNLNVLHVYDS